MILKEHHKQFAVKSYAQYMKRRQVVEEFIQKFPDDLPKPPPPPNFDPSKCQNKLNEIKKDKYLQREINKCYENYKIVWGDSYKEEWEKDGQTIYNELGQVYDQEWQKQQLKEYEQQCKNHHKNVKSMLSNQLRLYNINHPKFPKKYRELFDKTRQQFHENYFNQAEQNTNLISDELSILYAYAKEKLFQERDHKQIPKHVTNAHNLLKTIIAYDTLTQNQKEAIETKPEQPKQLTE